MLLKSVAFFYFLFSVSHSSVVTYLWWRGNCYNVHIHNFIRDITVKNFWNRCKVSLVRIKNQVCCFLRLHVHVGLICQTRLINHGHVVLSMLTNPLMICTCSAESVNAVEHVQIISGLVSTDKTTRPRTEHVMQSSLIVTNGILNASTGRKQVFLCNISALCLLNTLT